MKKPSTGLLLVFLGPALMVLIAGGFFYLYQRNEQRADPDFDASVARPAYTDRHPRVLFDEAHRNFHTTAGRYRPFVELLRNDGYQVSPNRQPFSAHALAGSAVLVIANARGPDEQGAQAAFTEGECDAVRNWVQGGGSLLLIVDHYPYGPAAESLARRFGVELRPGLTEDPAHHGPAADPSQLLFSRANGLLADHPVTRGRDPSERVGRVETFTGTSLTGPAGSAALLRLSEKAVDLAPEVKVEQAGRTTRTTVTYGRPTAAAGRAQGVAFEFGKGRVVALGEAAMLTAQLDPDGNRFGMNLPGNDNRQFALNLLHWLSGLLD